MYEGITFSSTGSGVVALDSNSRASSSLEVFSTESVAQEGLSESEGG